MPGAVRGPLSGSPLPPSRFLFPSFAGPFAGAGVGRPSGPHERARLPVDFCLSALPASLVRKSDAAF
ncbi:hypothetical protein VZT92_020087 [Zoarces viviparus]|uniref:Uncharacterized protein n=1 Tax=Zoarces viviparus TaxID=48416 RepID=A0AAW1EH12_ZOAVI